LYCLLFVLSVVGIVCCLYYLWFNTNHRQCKQQTIQTTENTNDRQ
jgi:hypothetical protein